MTPEEFAEKMKQIKENLTDGYGDEEDTHIAMDELMCKVLRELGYGEGIDIYDETPKWYA